MPQKNNFFSNDIGFFAIITLLLLLSTFPACVILNLLKSYIDALYSFGDSAVIRLKKRQNWEEVAKLR